MKPKRKFLTRFQDASAIFIDANILIDILDTSAQNRQMSLRTLNAALLSGLPVFVSPTTFAICSYFAKKYYKAEPNKLPSLLKEFFEPFQFTTEDADVMHKVLRSSFTDLEDAVQYFSAKKTFPSVGIIITWNTHHFPPVPLPVMSPHEFLTL